MCYRKIVVMITLSQHDHINAQQSAARSSYNMEIFPFYHNYSLSLAFKCTVSASAFTVNNILDHKCLSVYLGQEN